MAAKKNRGLRVFLTLVVVTGGVFAYGAGPGGWFNADEAAEIEGTPVRTGPLRISETVRGNLEAKDSIKLNCEVESRTTILYLIDEGARVQAGELIAELDVSEARDERVVQEISLQNALADYTKAKEQYDIQVIQNESDIAMAKQQYEFAEIDLDKYLQGDWPQELKLADEAIVLKEEELARAKEQLRWTDTLTKRGFVTRTELEADQFAVDRAKIEHDRAKREKDLLIEYGNPRQVAELEAKVAEMEREVRKVEKQAKARLADFEAARASAEARLGLEQETLAKIERQIEKGRIFAPEDVVDGMVVYARERSRWGSGDPISEGTEVRERQEIVTIPRSDGMIVEASLHETVLERVEVGQPCTVVVDALPGQSFAAEVQFVAVLPDSQSWYSSSSQRVYRAEVAILDPIDDMRPGMSCSVEILAAEFDDVLHVPVQAVFLDAGKPICFVRNPSGVEQRSVEVGLDNSKWVIIESGLAADEIVLLSPPAGFTPRAVERGEGERGPSGRPDSGGRGRPSGSGERGPGGAGRPVTSLDAASRSSADRSSSKKPEGDSQRRSGRPGGDREGGRPGGPRESSQ